MYKYICTLKNAPKHTLTGQHKKGGGGVRNFSECGYVGVCMSLFVSVCVRYAFNEKTRRARASAFANLLTVHKLSTMLDSSSFCFYAKPNKTRVRMSYSSRTVMGGGSLPPKATSNNVEDVLIVNKTHKIQP